MKLPVFRRDLLYDAFGNNPRMVAAFEELIAALTDAVGQAEAVPGVSAALQSTAFLLLSANDALAGGRVLTAGEGIALADDGSRVTVKISDLVPRIEGGQSVTFVVTGETNLILPEIGQVATIADVHMGYMAGVTSFNTRTGAVTLLSADVTGALGYTPTSVTGLTGVQTVAAFKLGLALVKGDVGLGNVDNTADAAKNVLSATKWTTGRTITLTGDATGVSGVFDGSAALSFAVTVGKINGVSLAGLATGILKNTTGTGVPSIAVAGDFPTLNQNTTGSAATLTTSRNFSISGGGITAAAVGFNGSAAVVLSASVDAGHITLARMANLAANSFIGNNTGSAATPIALTVAQAKTLLAISTSDVSGLGTAATQNTGTSGTTIPLCDGSNTWSGNNIFNALVRINGATGGQLGVVGTIYANAAETNTVFNGTVANTGACIIGSSGYWAIRADLNHGINFDVYNAGTPLTALNIAQGGAVTFGTYIGSKPYTVAGLPSAATAGATARAFVTDATATTYASTVVGGGANKVPVFSDGTNWKIG